MTLHQVLINRACHAFDGIIDPHDLAVGVIADLDHVPALMSENAPFTYSLSTLRRLFDAPVGTGNPGVWYDSGRSLGY